MKKQTVLALSTLSVLLSSTSAWAALDAKTFATNLYERQKKSITAQGFKITEAGTLTVAEQGNYSTVTYPALTLKNELHKIELGSIHMNLMPTVDGKEWKITTAIPNPIKFSSIDGSHALNLTLGSQNFSAIADEATLFPHMVNAQYKDLRLSPAGAKDVAFTFGDLTLKMDYKPDATGLLSGPFSFALNNMLIDATGPEQKDPGSLKIGSFLIDGNVTQMDTAMIRTYSEKMSELMDAGLNTEKSVSPESMTALWKIVMDYGLQQMDGIKASVAIKNVEFSKPAQTDKPAEDFKLAELGYRFDTSGLRSEKSKSDFAFVMKGLSASGIPVEFSKYVPHTINLSFGYKDLPHKALMQQLGSLATSGIAMESKNKSPANPQMMAMQAMMTVPALLAQAGTVFTINNTDIQSSDYGVNVNGEFKAMPQAVYGGTGTSKTIFTGLDALVTDLQAMVAKPDTKPDIAKKITQALQGLAAMQMFGQQGTDATGKPARIYDVTIDEKGMIKLNGTDMSALMGAQGGVPADTAAPSPVQAPSK